MQARVLLQKAVFARKYMLENNPFNTFAREYLFILHSYMYPKKCGVNTCKQHARGVQYIKYHALARETHARKRARAHLRVPAGGSVCVRELPERRTVCPGLDMGSDARAALRAGPRAAARGP
jgi:hypothetical protein